MLRMNKKVEYALIGMLHMYQKSEGELTSAKELAQCYNIPSEIMGKVLQRLVKAGLICSVQGAKGGYQLCGRIHQINLNKIYNAIEGPMQIVHCIHQRDKRECDQHHSCSIRNPMEIIQKKLEVFFNTITLKDLENAMREDGHLMRIKLG